MNYHRSITEGKSIALPQIENVSIHPQKIVSNQDVTVTIQGRNFGLGFGTLTIKDLSYPENADTVIGPDWAHTDLIKVWIWGNTEIKFTIFRKLLKTKAEGEQLNYSLMVRKANAQPEENSSPHPFSITVFHENVRWFELDELTQGEIAVKAQSNAWDARLEGGISPGIPYKEGGKYFLPYIGASGDRKAPHTGKGPANRALGIAISTNGMTNWKKWSANPVMRFSPSGNEEEGVFSGLVLKVNGNKHLFYSALTSDSPTTVNSDGYLKIYFKDGRESQPIAVLKHNDTRLVGHGDEIFPVGAVLINGVRFVYYVAKGGNVQWRLCIARLDNRHKVVKSAVVAAPDTGWRKHIYGACSPVKLANNRYGMLVLRNPKNSWNGKGHVLDLRNITVNLNDPLFGLASLSKPVEIAEIGKFNRRFTSAMLDRSSQPSRWLIFTEEIIGRRDANGNCSSNGTGHTCQSQIRAFHGPVYGQ